MYDYKCKEANVRQLNSYMLAKTRAMFVWDGLPETIPSTELEKLLQTNGWAFITKVEGKLYAFKGSLGGIEDVYGNPTQITINNVGLNFNQTLDLTDGVLIYSDSSSMGLLPLFNKLHLAQVESELTMLIQGYNERLNTLISASDDRTKESAEKFLEKIVGGELAVIGESPLLAGIKSHGKGATNPITYTIEYHQYIKGTLANEVGLRAATNMKRERLLQDEISQNDDVTYPFVHNMLACREAAVELINDKYELSVEVDFGSVWDVRHTKLMNQMLEDGLVDGDGEGDLVEVSEAGEAGEAGQADWFKVDEAEVKEALDAVISTFESENVEVTVETPDGRSNTVEGISEHEAGESEEGEVDDETK